MTCPLIQVNTLFKKKLEFEFLSFYFHKIKKFKGDFWAFFSAPID